MATADPSDVLLRVRLCRLCQVPLRRAHCREQTAWHVKHALVVATLATVEDGAIAPEVPEPLATAGWIGKVGVPTPVNIGVSA